ncbi:histone mono-ubiquitination 1 [Actinidia rufa]|uniref:E3 ubiquitin protein ligase n=1 Tax=Actinidia rufa TaxID=165716 RepID=A0A7J0F457_9ERIC|nr:histone mono-ubiquitination 1 [Actinidia rufa]
MHYLKLVHKGMISIPTDSNSISLEFPFTRFDLSSCAKRLFRSWILGISIADSSKVVITKCYHLFCNPCVQRVLESRHRKCAVCSASFGANDVKPVYI